MRNVGANIRRSDAGVLTARAAALAAEAPFNHLVAASAAANAADVLTGYIDTVTSDGVGFFAATTSTVAFWSAVSIDATHVEGGAKAFDIAGSQLWPQLLLGSEPLQSLWQEMEAALLAANQDWQVWTIWYNDRLDGRVRDEKRELAYALVDEASWEQGPAVVNAEIRKRIEDLGPQRSPSQSRRMKPHLPA